MPRLTLTSARIPTTHIEALRFLGDEDEVPIAHNTALVAMTTDPLGVDVIGVRLHNTVVVEMHRDGSYVLYAGPWQTVTTKQRINLFTPPGVRVYAVDHVWYVDVGDHGYEFEDGMVVRP